MALVRNGRSLFGSAGTLSGAVGFQIGNYAKAEQNRTVGGFSAIFSAYPNGALYPGAFVFPRSGGSISSYNRTAASITSSVALTPARPIEASSSVSISVSSAQLDQIVSAVASGSMSLSAAASTLAGAASLVASSTLQVSVASSLCGAIFSVTASSSSSASGSGSALTAKANMEAAAGGATPLSPEGLATSLLDGNDIEDGFTMRETLKLILATLAGKVSGAGGATITIRDVNDGTDRIIATVDSNGNRTSVIYDVS